ncbi:hypothetical protein D3C76_1352110 [compost metagenome]
MDRLEFGGFVLNLLHFDFNLHRYRFRRLYMHRLLLRRLYLDRFHLHRFFLRFLLLNRLYLRYLYFRRLHFRRFGRRHFRLDAGWNLRSRACNGSRVFLSGLRRQHARIRS